MGAVAVAVSPLIITELCKPAPVYQGLLNFITTQRNSYTYHTLTYEKLDGIIKDLMVSSEKPTPITLYTNSLKTMKEFDQAMKRQCYEWKL